MFEPFTTYGEHYYNYRSPVRFWLGFALLVLWTFGLLAYGFAMLFTGRPVAALATVVVVFVTDKYTPRFTAWLVGLGAPVPPPDKPTA